MFERWKQFILVATAVCATCGTAVATADEGGPEAGVAGRGDDQRTIRLTNGNASSRNAVISQDRRFAKVIAFESDANNLGPRDTNALTDIYFITRRGGDNVGTPWRTSPIRLASRAFNGGPANGRSFAPAIDGGFRRRQGEATHPRCLAFLSEASNLVRGDTNGRTDAFVSRGPGGALERISVDGASSQLPDHTTAVAVSTDCSHFAFVAGGRLYVRTDGRSERISTRGAAADPSFSSALSDELVLSAGGDVYLMSQRVRGGERGGDLLAPQFVAKGTNPAFNDVKCRVVAYEKQQGGHRQIAWRLLGQGEDAGTGATCADLPGGNRRTERIASKFRSLGNGDSRNPTVHNAGFYIGFESDATNLATKAGPVGLDRNGVTDAYLYTGVRDHTLVMSQPGQPKGVPFTSGGLAPSSSWYANYVVFSSAGNVRVEEPGDDELGGDDDEFIDDDDEFVDDEDEFGGRGRAAGAAPVQQIYMRYLGEV